jgi:hypothetical protein
MCFAGCRRTLQSRSHVDELLDPREGHDGVLHTSTRYARPEDWRCTPAGDGDPASGWGEFTMPANPQRGAVGLCS